jgi:hypothetical protein
MQNPYFTERLAAERRRQLLVEARQHSLAKGGRVHRRARLLGALNRFLALRLRALRPTGPVPGVRTAIGSLALKVLARGRS